MWPETNFTPVHSTLPDALARLADHIATLPVTLAALSEQELTEHQPGKWSKKQVIGHLIDSARYNLERFTEAQCMPEPYRVGSYRQNELVVVNQYQTVPTSHLLMLWQNLNQQILYVAQNLTVQEIDRRLTYIDNPTVPFTLSWLIQDYVGHLEHHLKTLYSQ